LSRTRTTNIRPLHEIFTILGLQQTTTSHPVINH